LLSGAALSETFSLIERMMRLMQHGWLAADGAVGRRASERPCSGQSRGGIVNGLLVLGARMVTPPHKALRGLVRPDNGILARAVDRIRQSRQANCSIREWQVLEAGPRCERAGLRIFQFPRPYQGSAAWRYRTLAQPTIQQHVADAPPGRRKNVPQFAFLIHPQHALLSSAPKVAGPRKIQNFAKPNIHASVEGAPPPLRVSILVRHTPPFSISGRTHRHSCSGCLITTRVCVLLPATQICAVPCTQL
jgi:hypothetical protein